jgi:hypothetical protein
MTRRAAENAYLHKDFHGALSAGLDYLEEHGGEQAVRDYLRQFARAYYAPLVEAIRRAGLEALEEHFTRIYRIEGGEIRMHRSGDELRIEVMACPAVKHLREHGYPVARLFHETTRTVNEAICEGTPVAFELLDYDPLTGRSVQRFFPRVERQGSAKG